MRTLRTKLLIGFLPSLLIMAGLGLWAVLMLYKLGSNIELILRENYKSILAVERMREALERMDSGLMFAVGGRLDLANTQFDRFRPEFEKQLHIQQGNVTLPGEQELTDELSSEFDHYSKLGDRFFHSTVNTTEERSRLYFSEALPTFNKLKDLSYSILLLNQKNMEEMDRRARTNSSASIRVMLLALACGIGMAIVSCIMLGRSILGPIQGVTQGARALERGELDQVVAATTRDELGELATAFNAMARTIREYRESGTAKLLRAQKTAQATIDSFPDPVILVDLGGLVERSNPAARRVFGIASPESGSVAWSPPSTLAGHLGEVLGGSGDYLPAGLEHSICLRDEEKERFFMPRVLSIRGSDGATLGAAIVLVDVTKFRLVDQLKSDMVSTVSHELKTPLTGLQMAVHLLLEEIVGPLNSKQTELLLSARQDSDRLLAIVNDLLDLTRIEQGQLDLKPTAPADLISEVVERFESTADSYGVELRGSVSFGLPPVLANHERISHVFDNLIKNAIYHTPRGGSVTLSAAADDRMVRFSVEDTGEGIPSEYITRVFDRFVRVPGSHTRDGAGLGLAIAKEIVTSHGGQIDVRSREGEGTTFTFTLPVALEGSDPISSHETPLNDG